MINDTLLFLFHFTILTYPIYISSAMILSDLSAASIAR